MTSRLAVLAIAGLALGLPLLAAPQASADSFYFGFSSGPRHRHHGRHHHGYHHHWRPPYYSGYYYPPPPRVVYVPPPVVYVPPPLAAVPTSPVFRAADGQYCREYQATVTVNGMPQPSYGTACLQPDGAWRVVD
jgi:hypothetical protein